MRKTSTILAAALILGSLSGAANAATTTFGSPYKLLNDGSNLLNIGGTVVDAANFTTGGLTPTINGIAFTAENYTGGNAPYDYTGTNGNWDLSYVTPNGGGQTGHDTGRAGGESIAPTDAIYDFANEAAFANCGVISVSPPPEQDGDWTLTLSNLTVGTDYTLQLGFTFDGNRTITVTDESSSTSVNVNYGGGAGMQMLTGTFTADAATEAYAFSGGFNDIAGFTLQSAPVPEPTSLGLLAIGGLGLLARRRRA